MLWCKCTYPTLQFFSLLMYVHEVHAFVMHWEKCNSKDKELKLRSGSVTIVTVWQTAVLVSNAYREIMLIRQRGGSTAKPEAVAVFVLSWLALNDSHIHFSIYYKEGRSWGELRLDVGYKYCSNTIRSALSLNCSRRKSNSALPPPSPSYTRMFIMQNYIALKLDLTLFSFLQHLITRIYLYNFTFTQYSWQCVLNCERADLFSVNDSVCGCCVDRRVVFICYSLHLVSSC